MKINLTFSGQLGQCNSIKYIYISLLSERENTVLQWKFKLNCAMAAAENRDLKDHTPKAKW